MMFLIRIAGTLNSSVQKDIFEKAHYYLVIYFRLLGKMVEHQKSMELLSILTLPRTSRVNLKKSFRVCESVSLPVK